MIGMETRRGGNPKGFRAEPDSPARRDRFLGIGSSWGRWNRRFEGAKRSSSASQCGESRYEHARSADQGSAAFGRRRSAGRAAVAYLAERLEASDTRAGRMGLFDRALPGASTGDDGRLGRREDPRPGRHAREGQLVILGLTTITALVSLAGIMVELAAAKTAGESRPTAAPSPSRGSPSSCPGPSCTPCTQSIIRMNITAPMRAAPKAWNSRA